MIAHHPSCKGCGDPQACTCPDEPEGSAGALSDDDPTRLDITDRYESHAEWMAKRAHGVRS